MFVSTQRLVLGNLCRTHRHAWRRDCRDPIVQPEVTKELLELYRVRVVLQTCLSPTDDAVQDLGLLGVTSYRAEPR